MSTTSTRRTVRTIAARAAAGIAAAGLAAGLALGTAGAAGATGASYAKPHDIFGSIREHCHQHDLFHPADTTTIQPFYTFIATGEPNGPFNTRTIETTAVQAGNIFCATQLRMNEKDAQGTLHVQANAGGNWVDWLGEHPFRKTVEFDLAPNQTRTVSLRASSNGGDFDAATITITNQVL